MINIALNIGQIALAISANVQQGREGNVLAKGMASEVYRATASKVFGPKGHARDEAYSDALGLDALNAIKLVLGENFSDISVQHSAKPASAKKQLSVEDVLASLDVEQLEAALAAKKAKVEESEDSIG